MEGKNAINLGSYDWGFSLVDADELSEVQEVRSELTQTESTANEWMEQSEQWRQKAQSIYAAVIPLLNNLSTEPEKEYIYWPGEDRVNKINAFKLKLNQILED